MGRKKLFKPKPRENVSYHTELHHTCSNPAICKTRVSPCGACKDCNFYKNRETPVADEPARLNIDWGF